ncbi:MAG TPA: tRNA lysidine(34) synthetase TilS, partial [Parafilimonas sp.]|nr:tRNA lysidine(34) synthetase TilS [Parafilimonas sp.]
MMNLLERFQQNWKDNFHHLSTANCHLVLAVSGGLDSVVLMDLISKTGFNFCIAHCNFQLRGDESERDEQFVRSLATKYNKEIFVKSFNTKSYAEEKKLSIQEAARELRYTWFFELITSNLKPQTSNFVLTAHHADDNIETMLMFFFRGTGIHGLTGIPVYDKKRKLIRPLLFAAREDILAYANDNNLKWVEDSSNTSDKYTRNFFRNELLPAIGTHFPQAKDNLQRNISRFADAAELYRQAIQLQKKKLLEIKGNEVHIPVLKLQRAEPLDTIIWEIIREYGFHAHQVPEIKKLFTAENSSYVQSTSHRIIRNRKWLIIAPNAATEADLILIEADTKAIELNNGTLSLEVITTSNGQAQTSNFKHQTSNLSAHLDAKLI